MKHLLPQSKTDELVPTRLEEVLDVFLPEDTGADLREI